MTSMQARAPFSITTLGTGTCTPSVLRGTAAYVVTAGDQRYLVDSGSGTIARLAAAGFHLDDLGAFFYTHTHLDHSGDLFNILFSMRNGANVNRTSLLPIYGPPGFVSYFDHLMVLYDRWVSSEAYDIEVADMGGELKSVQFGDLTVEAFRVRHSAVAVGYRFTLQDAYGDRVIAYTGDADEGFDLEPLLKVADLAVLDCSTLAAHKLKGHLSAEQVGKIASSAGVKRVVLSHFYPPLLTFPQLAVDEARSHCDSVVVAASDGKTFKVV